MGVYAVFVSLLTLATLWVISWQTSRRIRDQWLAVTEAVGDIEHRLRKVEATVAALQAVPVVQRVHPITGEGVTRTIGEGLRGNGWARGHGG
jgi:hypothetical protein